MENPMAVRTPWSAKKTSRHSDPQPSLSMMTRNPVPPHIVPRRTTSSVSRNKISNKSDAFRGLTSAGDWSIDGLERHGGMPKLVPTHSASSVIKSTQSSVNERDKGGGVDNVGGMGVSVVRGDQLTRLGDGGLIAVPKESTKSRPYTTTASLRTTEKSDKVVVSAKQSFVRFYEEEIAAKSGNGGGIKARNASEIPPNSVTLPPRVQTAYPSTTRPIETPKTTTTSSNNVRNGKSAEESRDKRDIKTIVREKISIRVAYQRYQLEGCWSHLPLTEENLRQHNEIHEAEACGGSGGGMLFERVRKWARNVPQYPEDPFRPATPPPDYKGVIHGTPAPSSGGPSMDGGDVNSSSQIIGGNATTAQGMAAALSESLLSKQSAIKEFPMMMISNSGSSANPRQQHNGGGGDLRPMTTSGPTAQQQFIKTPAKHLQNQNSGGGAGQRVLYGNAANFVKAPVPPEYQVDRGRLLCCLKVEIKTGVYRMLPVHEKDQASILATRFCKANNLMNSLASLQEHITASMKTYGKGP